MDYFDRTNKMVDIVRVVTKWECHKGQEQTLVSANAVNRIDTASTEICIGIWRYIRNSTNEKSHNLEMCTQLELDFVHWDTKNTSMLESGYIYRITCGTTGECRIVNEYPLAPFSPPGSLTSGIDSSHCFILNITSSLLGLHVPVSPSEAASQIIS